MNISVQREPRVTEQEQADFDWLMNHLHELAGQYPDRWVAVCQGEVAAVADGGVEAEQSAKRAKGEDCRPVIHFVEGGAYVYTGRVRECPQSAAPLVAARAKRVDPPATRRQLRVPHSRILVQPVLDKHCVRCHSGAKPKGGVSLTGEPERHYTKSYNVLSARVPYSDQGNAEAVSQPGCFGARGSPVMQKLLAGHHDVKLSAEDVERLATWMDANALFYGAFDPADQARQLRAERIEGPKLE